jgi:hypothetical protein
MKARTTLLLLAILVATAPARADFGGTVHAHSAESPDGNLVVRIVRNGTAKSSGELAAHLVRFYEFDAAKDLFGRKSEFPLTGSPAHCLYVSNHGDLVLVSLNDKDAVRLLSNNGRLIRSWALADFLSGAEINACAKTGATLQWLDEGAFLDREFYFKGPSHRIRALHAPFTVMRGVDLKVSFSGTIDAQSGELLMEKAKD